MRLSKGQSDSREKSTSDLFLDGLIAGWLVSYFSTIEPEVAEPRSMRRAACMHVCL
jgi:hypothetical protein